MIDVLNQALATEIVCVLRYKRHYFMADGLNGGPVAAEFLQHANEEMGHADQIALRITQLQGEPNFSPAGIEDRSHSEYVEGNGLVDMIKEDLVAERIAIESYAEIVQWLGDKDPTTRAGWKTSWRWRRSTPTTSSTSSPTSRSRTRTGRALGNGDQRPRRIGDGRIPEDEAVDPERGGGVDLGLRTWASP